MKLDVLYKSLVCRVGESLAAKRSRTIPWLDKDDENKALFSRSELDRFLRD